MSIATEIGLDKIGSDALSKLEAKHNVREIALTVSRAIIRASANAIRATHRDEFDEAQKDLDAVAEQIADLKQQLHDHPDIYWAGYVQDALKEYAEARITLSLIRHNAVPHMDEIGVDVSPYLNALGEAVGELRRKVLDIIRHQDVEQAERFLEIMDEIYNLLVTVDYPDALTGGLRRTTDNVRGILERTRGDLTIALRQQRLEKALTTFYNRIGIQ